MATTNSMVIKPSKTYSLMAFYEVSKIHFVQKGILLQISVFQYINWSK